MKIDAHQHFWKIDRGDYDWLTPELKELYRDFLPHDLKPLMEKMKIDGTILIQAAPTVAETEFLLSLAERHTYIKGVVGWVDFESPSATRDIGRLSNHPKLVGLRPMIQDIPEIEWMLNSKISHIFRALIAADLTFDALVLPSHLTTLRQLIERHPDMRVIIDHGAKPQIKSKLFDDWAQNIEMIGRETGAYCKLSGLATEAPEKWRIDDLKPYVDHLIEVFGTERLIWGSDWPVCTLACEYTEWVNTVETLLSTHDISMDKVLGGNAVKAYRL